MRDLRGISFAISVACVGILPTEGVRAQTGNAAYYHGKRTASGEGASGTEFTAAHRTLPFGTQVRVTNLRNGRSMIVRINDRGPFGRGRIIDVSRAAARELGMIGSGTAKVRIDPQ
jgi:rare lipoprotein A